MFRLLSKYFDQEYKWLYIVMNKYYICTTNEPKLFFLYLHWKRPIDLKAWLFLFCFNGSNEVQTFDYFECPSKQFFYILKSIFESNSLLPENGNNVSKPDERHRIPCFKKGPCEFIWKFNKFLSLLYSSNLQILKKINWSKSLKCSFLRTMHSPS